MNPIVGKAVIDKSFVYHYAGYETAAWWTDSEVVPGEYEARLDNTSTGWVCWSYPTTIVDEYFPALFGGVPIGGSSRREEHIGQPNVVHCRPYAYSVAAACLAQDGKSYPIMHNKERVGTFFLADDWEAIEVKGSYEFDGEVRKYTSHKLVQLASA